MKPSNLPFDEEFRGANLAGMTNLTEEQTQVLSNWVKNPRDFLLFLGNPGCRKSYFCCAVYNYFTQDKPIFWPHGYPCLPFIITEKDFFHQMRKEIELGHDHCYEIEKLKYHPFIIFDDMGVNQKTEWQKEVLHDFINSRVESRLPTIITSNLYLYMIKEKYEERFFSRLSSKRNSFIEVKGIDYRTGQ